MDAMIGKGKKERDALNRMADFFVDEILSASDEDVLAEFAETHGDPDHSAVQMRALFEKSLLRSNKKRLAAAKAGAADSRRLAMVSKTVTVDVQTARARLRAVVDTPGLPERITLAARKENELSDLDILGMLEDLQELGILPADDGRDS
jgi:hypothetical protein